MTDFLNLARRLKDETVKNRRFLHQHPELGFQENLTSSFVLHSLRAENIETIAGMAGTGLVAYIKGQKPTPLGMLRFDMDALPIQEETGLEYASQNDGVMHACGHDGHTAIGLTVCKMLKNAGNELDGSLRCIFQPAEEGEGGAAAMIKDGVIDDSNLRFILGMHLWNEKPVGWVGVKAGHLMAAADNLEIRIIGKGGHGGDPSKTADPVVCAAQMISGLQLISSRNLSAFEQAVISVTMISGGTTYNVIPGEVVLKGTIRTFTKDVQNRIHKRVVELSENIAMAFGCTAEILIQPVTSAVVNDTAVTNSVQKVIEEKYSFLNIDTQYQTTISEDMALYLDKIPGCFLLVGSANKEKGAWYPHHHPRFNFDEEIMPIAAALMADCSKELLNKIP